MTTPIDHLHSALRSQFHGELLRPTDAGYPSAHTIWNGMVARKPGLIARCADEVLAPAMVAWSLISLSCGR